jgi:hypothetical protein
MQPWDGPRGPTGRKEREMGEKDIKPKAPTTDKDVQAAGARKAEDRKTMKKRGTMKKRSTMKKRGVN